MVVPMAAIHSLPSLIPDLTKRGLPTTIPDEWQDADLFEAATLAIQEITVLYSEAAKPAQQIEIYLPWRYRKFKNVDFQKEPREMCELIQVSQGKLSEIPESLWKKLTKAAMYLTTFKLSHMIIAKGVLKKLASIFRNVTTVRLQNIAFRDSIHEIVFFEKMTRLSLAQSTRVATLEPVHLANVTVLDVSETHVYDDWLKTLQHCERLEHLFLARCTKFTEKGFKEVLQIPKLRALNVFKCPPIRPKVIANATRTHDHIKINTLNYSIDGPLSLAPPRKPPTHQLVHGMSQLKLEEPLPQTVHFPVLVPR